VSRGKPIIGIAGGIGSGKSFVAQLFGELGCLVISSDDQVREAYRDSTVVATLRQWWGDEVLTPVGEVNKRVIAAKVFGQPVERERLEKLLHPMVNRARERLMEAAATDPKVPAYVWDTPLLMETGLNRLCDKVVFVDAPRDRRIARVRDARNWSEANLDERENLQMPLDKKREISDYCISNTADADYARGQVRDTLSRILAETQPQSASP